MSAKVTEGVVFFDARTSKQRINKESSTRSHQQGVLKTRPPDGVFFDPRTSSYLELWGGTIRANRFRPRGHLEFAS